MIQRGLAHLAVVHDVEPGLHLAFHDVADGVVEGSLVRGRVDRLAACLGREEVEDGPGTREAAGMGSQDSIHQSSSPKSAGTTGAPG